MNNKYDALALETEMYIYIYIIVCIHKLTVAAHSQFETLLQSTVLATVSVYPIDDALFVAWTLVVHDGALRTPEEAFTALACDDTIVNAR